MWLKSAEVSGLKAAFEDLLPQGWLQKNYFEFIFQNFVLVLLFKIASLNTVSHNSLRSFFKR